MLLVGYSENVKGYRLYDPTSHNVIVARDVVFMENIDDSLTTSIAIEGKNHLVRSADMASPSNSDEENSNDKTYVPDNSSSDTDDSYTDTMSMSPETRDLVNQQCDVNLPEKCVRRLQFESNTVENVEAIYTTLALLCVELASDETICDMVQLIMAIQHSALSNPVLSRAQRYHLHALVVSLLSLLPRVLHLPHLLDYVEKIIDARQNEASHLLPSLSEDYEDLPSPSKMPYLMVDHMAVTDCLKVDGIDTSRLQSPSPYTSGTVSHLGPHRHSWVEAGAVQGRESLADIGPSGTELDSANSSPGVQRHQTHNESVSLEALRRAAAAPGEAERREAERRRVQLNKTFRTAPFSQLVALTQPKYELKDKLEEIFNSLSDPLVPPIASPQSKPNQNMPAYQKYFPELFLY
ncbi:Protein EFR3 homolog cmp44E [Eumeta japonica]|uniref:Protein EFR3 homolog cmp44E n=1 Tax=Eumeta variegata TaxID=151549 RepID=A0A4C1XM24_EUMVA|nr:Protein EFR3 homolog cmp44E [Eumeta japonica]